ncbi:DUF6268 family outer membrane beta-barrel protein [Ancylomarina sp. DW003]|uniref:DUF6268 family outer membrane beta-barrel protein n=1 Tax=Paralabilibaculum antarcticum TaxID=2912572 RepID=A0ABT5VPI8_9BACT|nr:MULTISPECIES: DUF6268 family outer membrane beta-barrel protein [Marinifilaceae]MDE5417165.1 DUF6268 family outer membrane beta-barrel protein [Labilibaculum sp. DW002]MDE5424210.1 DUF6268 family outer membrane beta-barrel protein [Ancylomarina sp. DW003]
MKNFTIKLTFAVIISAFVFSSAQAQMEKEDLSLNYSYIGEGDSGSHQKIAFSKFEAKANLYRKLTKKGALYFHTVSYANMNIDYSAELGIPTELEQFHSFSYSIGASVPLKNEWRLTGVFSPTLASNFEGDVQFNDLQFLGIIFLGKAINKLKNLHLNIGAMYSNTLGSPTPLPYFSLTWKPNKQLTYELGFPNTGITYKVNEKLSLGSKLFIAGDNLRLGDNLVYQNESTPIDNIRLTNFGWGLEAQKKFGKHFKLKLAGGHTFSRKFEFNDGSKVVEDFDLDNNFYGTVGLSILF